MENVFYQMIVMNQKVLVVKAKFIRKYGRKYEHTFKLNKDNDYYWEKSIKLN